MNKIKIISAMICIFFLWNIDSFAAGGYQYYRYDDYGNIKVSLGTKLAGEDATNDVMKTEQQFSYKYQAAAAADVVVKASPGFLHAIIVGKNVGAGAIIEVSDHVSDGDGNVQVYLEAPAVGTYIVDAKFTTGICVDMTLQTNVTFIYR